MSKPICLKRRSRKKKKKKKGNTLQDSKFPGRIEPRWVSILNFGAWYMPHGLTHSKKENPKSMLWLIRLIVYREGMRATPSRTKSFVLPDHVTQMPDRLPPGRMSRSTTGRDSAMLTGKLRPRLDKSVCACVCVWQLQGTSQSQSKTPPVSNILLGQTVNSPTRALHGISIAQVRACLE